VLTWTQSIVRFFASASRFSRARCRMGKQCAVGKWGTKRRASRTGVDGAAKARRGGARAAARVNVALLCQFQVSRGEE
jgi:hypothetical protein